VFSFHLYSLSITPPCEIITFLMTKIKSIKLTVLIIPYQSCHLFLLKLRINILVSSLFLIYLFNSSLSPSSFLRLQHYCYCFLFCICFSLFTFLFTLTWPLFFSLFSLDTVKQYLVTFLVLPKIAQGADQTPEVFQHDIVLLSLLLLLSVSRDIDKIHYQSE